MHAPKIDMLSPALHADHVIYIDWAVQACHIVVLYVNVLVNSWKSSVSGIYLV